MTGLSEAEARARLTRHGPNRLPPPGWLDRLRADIGDSRLLLFQDSRQDLENFRAVVLLF